MSLIPEAYEKRKWRGLEALRSALADQKLDDRHYGWSSAAYNNFEAISDLLQIGTLALDSRELLKASEVPDLERDIRELSERIRDIARMLQDMSDELRRSAGHIAQKLPSDPR